MKNLYPIINLDSISAFNEKFLIKCFNLNPDYLQIRMKNSTVDDLITVSKNIVSVRDRLDMKTKIIVNDSVEAAVISMADGVHLGQGDDDPSTIKNKVPGLIVGYSTHSIEQIKKANLMDIDYIGFGPVYTTLTKKDHDKLVSGLTEKAVSETRHPIVFIGGINKNNIEFLPSGDKIYYALISGISGFLSGESDE